MADSNTIGFIGGGEMAYALAMGFVAEIDGKNIHVSNPSAGKLERFSCKGINVGHDNMEVFHKCDVVFLCVKPQIYPEVVKEILNTGRNKSWQKLVISVMAGITISTMKETFPSCRIVRTIPNTAALVRAGTTVASMDESASAEDKALTAHLFSLCGLCEFVPERLMDAGMSISGCGIGWMYSVMDAFADGGVKMGLPRKTALRLAANMFIGTGKMYLESGKHPGDLKDSVTSPGGTTICGLHEIEKGGVRAAVINAIEAASNKAIELGKPK